MRNFRTLIFLLFIIFNLSCKETHKNITSKPSSLHNVAKEYKASDPAIIRVLRAMDLSYFPPVLRLYFEGNKMIKTDYVDNTTLRIKSAIENKSILLQIKLLTNNDNSYVFFVNAIKQDSLVYNSYFYVVQYSNSRVENITLYVIPEDFLQILRLEFKTEFLYKKLGNFWAYISNQSHSALDFSFYGNIALVKQCFLFTAEKKYKCNAFLKLIWTGQKFIFKLLKDSSSAGLLDEKQLDKVKRFTSLQEALINPEQVYILDLNGKGLKTLPDQIVRLKRLQILILSNNSLERLPEQIGQISHLQILRADHNKLKTVPKSMGNLFYLQELDLSHNQIAWIPYEFANLKHLEKLSLAYNDLDVLAFNMSNLDYLFSLNLSHNKFSKVPYQVFNLKNLVYLDLSYNPIKVLPREFIDMSQLQYLIIKNTLVDTSQVRYLQLKRKDLKIIF